MTVMDPGDDSPPPDPRSAAGVQPKPPPPGLAEPAPVPRLSPEQVAAFSTFYRTDIARLVTFLRVQGASWAEATDAAQEAMARAYQHWADLDNPGAWVRTVASREFIRRRTNIRENLTDEVPEPPTRLLRDDALATVQEQEEELEVQRLLAGLPARQRQVLAWTYDQYTPAQIAAQLSTPVHPVTPEAVRSSLKLARRTLAQQLGLGEAQP
jgi:RNA polymerase sigma factor (sigma-70 family)